MFNVRSLPVLALTVLIAACGGATEPPSPASPPAPTATPVPEPPAGAATPAPAVAPAAAESATPKPVDTAAPESPSATGPTKAALDEANKIVMDAYPAPFAKTYAKVVAKIGEPKKKADNMFEWFTSNNGKCVEFFMTKDAKKGHAASGFLEADAAACK